MGKSKTNTILDTSILIESIKHPSNKFQSYLSQHSMGKIMTLNYCLLEFSMGLLRVWVEFYQDVEILKDIPAAKAKFSDRFQSREVKNFVLLESCMAKLQSSIEVGDIDLFLDQVEFAINWVRRDVVGKVNKVIGSFHDHPLLQFELFSREEYSDFLIECKKSGIVPISEFLKNNNDQVQLLKANLSKTHYTTKEKREHRDAIIALIENIVNADSKSQNRKWGDVIISLDSPKKNLLLSTDSRFELLCVALEKKFIVTSKPNYN